MLIVVVDNWHCNKLNTVSYTIIYKNIFQTLFVLWGILGKNELIYIYVCYFTFSFTDDINSVDAIFYSVFNGIFTFDREKRKNWAVISPHSVSSKIFFPSYAIKQYLHNIFYLVIPYSDYGITYFANCYKFCLISLQMIHIWTNKIATRLSSSQPSIQVWSSSNKLYNFTFLMKLKSYFCRFWVQNLWKIGNPFSSSGF